MKKEKKFSLDFLVKYYKSAIINMAEDKDDRHYLEKDEKEIKWTKKYTSDHYGYPGVIKLDFALISLAKSNKIDSSVLTYSLLTNICSYICLRGTSADIWYLAEDLDTLKADNFYSNIRADQYYDYNIIANCIAYRADKKYNIFWSETRPDFNSVTKECLMNLATAENNINAKLACDIARLVPNLSLIEKTVLNKVVLNTKNPNLSLDILESNSKMFDNKHIRIINKYGDKNTKELLNEDLEISK